MSKSGNTYGKVTGDTPKAGVPAERGNPAENEQNILEAAQGATKRAIDDWVESTGYNQGAMIAGAVATAVVEVFMPTAWWELVPVGKAAKIIKKGAEAVGVVKKGEAAAEVAKDAKKADDASKAGGTSKAEKKPESGDGRTDTQVKKKAPGPCDHLRQGSGTGPYRGGAHSKTSKPVNDGKDSHHMPADDVSPLSRNDGPAIQMDPGDHKATSSNGSSRDAVQYRQLLEQLLKEGKWRDAMAMEIKDIRQIAKEIGDPKKYNEAMQEMLEYFKCLEKNGLLPRG